MENLINQLDNVQKVSSKKNRYWDRIFKNQIGDARISFVDIQKDNLKTKTILNSLESLIDILGSILTDRPLTSLVAAYKDVKGNVQRIQVDPSKYFQVRQASLGPSMVSIEGIRKLVSQGIIEVEEENRALKWLELETSKGVNKGHKLEAYESIRKNRRITTRKFKEATQIASANKTPWNKGGDVNEFQVKYLGTENNYWGNNRKTASQISIEEIVIYFLKLKNDIIQGSNLVLQAQAIFSAFVETENIHFYGQGGFVQKNVDELLETMKKEWENSGISIPS